MCTRVCRHRCSRYCCRPLKLRSLWLPQVLADVFGCPVVTMAQSDSASLGAALRAMHGWRGQQEGRVPPFSDIVGMARSAGGALHLDTAAAPDASAHETYTSLLPRIAALEERLMRRDKV